jgi:serine/threonine-protein kinase
VHRDVSPQNVLVGRDGIARVLDFGVAKAMGRLRTTPSGEIKGKLAYIAPEQLCAADVDLRADIYGASVVLWEMLTGCRLFDEPSESAMVNAVLGRAVAPPSSENPAVPLELDRIVLRGLSRAREERFGSAREMAIALERVVGTATQSEIRDWVVRLAGERLAMRAVELRSLQRTHEADVPQAHGISDVRATRRLEIAEHDAAVRQEPAPGHVAVARSSAQRARAYATALLLGLILLVAMLGAPANSMVAPHDAPPQAYVPPRALEESALPAVAARVPLEPLASVKEAEPPAPSPTSLRRAPKAKSMVKTKSATATPTATATAKHAQSACVPPFVIDHEGVKHPKRECF